MNNTELLDFFKDKETYDNSKIVTIRGCKRKAYYKQVGPQGVPLSMKVGDGANFGSAIHAGVATYFNNWHKTTENNRRYLAYRAFGDEWSLNFPTERMQPKHLLNNGLGILEAYFDHYLESDSLFEPVEAELGFAIEIIPVDKSANLPCDCGNEEWGCMSSSDCYRIKTKKVLYSPFYYIGRIDGIFRKLSDDTYWMRETKTVGQTNPFAIEKRIGQLKFDHQPIGYVTCIRELNPQYRLTGFIPDVIGVAANSIAFGRDYFSVTNRQSASWKQQLVNTVEDWRAMVARGEVTPHLLDKLDVFYQDTQRCDEYGRCSFYDLCDFGVNSDTLSMFDENTWNPLLKRGPEKILIG